MLNEMEVRILRLAIVGCRYQLAGRTPKTESVRSYYIGCLTYIARQLKGDPAAEMAEQLLAQVKGE